MSKHPLQRKRKSFGTIRNIVAMPNLIQVQKQSYGDFLQIDVPAEKRLRMGLQDVLISAFPIQDYAGTSTLEFVKYEFDAPKFDVDECRQRGINFAAPLRVTLRLIVWDVDPDTAAREIKGIKEQDVYMGDIPLMTENGTFIINGTERVIVSQMHRSPGVFFDHDRGKSHASGKFLYSARIIPYRGSWLDFEFDAKDLVFFRVDRRRKLYVATLLRALGMDNQQILDSFYGKVVYQRGKKGWSTAFESERLRGYKLLYPLIDAKTGKEVAEAGTKMTPRLGKKLQADGLVDQLVALEHLQGAYISADLIDPDSGEVLMAAGAEITLDSIAKIEASSLKEFATLAIDHMQVGPYIRNTLFADKTSSKEEALMDIYRVMRPGEPPHIEAATAMFHSLFFDPERYDLSVVGRVKLNARLDLNHPEDVRILTFDDIVCIVRMLMQIKDGNGQIDDIDHLGNRRVRSVGELMENQFRIGLVRMERAIIERMSAVAIDTVMPHDLINAKLLGVVVREFFGSSQLSQFMDQTNPLSEITHKRRLSALGPGGLTRDRASVEVRDVHPTHYSRICPVETPEGQNIGLINSMATFAHINKHGFIESPYRRVVNNRITDEVVYLSAIEEGKYTIAQANAKMDSKGTLTEDLISARFNSDFLMVPREQIQFIDVSPMQLVSVAASLIPFLENDDASRALMGSNMQRQAVPLVYSDAPLIGTGIEGLVARDSGATMIVRRAGIVDQVDSTRVVIRAEAEGEEDSPGVDIYNLQKFQRSNYNTCINQKPLVRVGDVVRKGDVIADGPSTDQGELALGRNVLVAFMPWNGYNFEDSILISERIVKDDIFTSIHIEKFEVVARDTRLGPEEITRDIPNVGEESLRHLDEVGIVHVGAEVKAGDILVGKVTPKSESPMTPEEKLLRAIFGEKASDVRDSSMHVPPGVSGTVVEVRVFSRRGVEKDERALAIERQEIDRLAKDRDDELGIMESFVFERLESLLIGKPMVSGPKNCKLASGTKLTKAHLKDYSHGQWWQFVVDDTKIMHHIEVLHNQLKSKVTELTKRFNNKVEKLRVGDDLMQGELKKVAVFIAVKHKLQPGDKMAGRHGNKGVISRILPAEDMPHLADGTVVDMVLNPLGVPSRMNVGQILETHLGWASKNLGNQIAHMVNEVNEGARKHNELATVMKDIYESEEVAAEIDQLSPQDLIKVAKDLERGVPFATPVFNGAHGADIERMLAKAGVDRSGQVTLFDGRTGEPFDRNVTIGIIYMLKLHHLVDEKIHARSIGPYSLVTQQPLGGKSHFGGQRFGEMECWALQAYGASYTLQEMLTVKSDDVAGRIKIYESIVRGDHHFESGIPESFHVMIKELRSLCLNVVLEQEDVAIEAA
jgi:DNA-directed RNA polymerase subunit beta